MNSGSFRGYFEIEFSERINYFFVEVAVVRHNGP